MLYVSLYCTRESMLNPRAEFRQLSKQLHPPDDKKLSLHTLTPLTTPCSYYRDERTEHEGERLAG